MSGDSFSYTDIIAEKARSVKMGKNAQMGEKEKFGYSSGFSFSIGGGGVYADPVGFFLA